MKKLLVYFFLIILLAGCSGSPSLTPIPTIVLPPSSSSTPTPIPVGVSNGTVSASGEVVPVQQIDLSFGVAGIVQTVNIKEGDRVKAGQAIAVLDNIPELEALLKSNQQSLASAQNDLDNLASNAPLNLANAQLAMTTAQKQYDDAVQRHKVRGVPRCDKDKIDLFFQILGDAKKKLDDLTNEPHESTVSYLQRIDIAQGEYDVAQANYEYCIKYTDQEIAESDATLAVADATLKQTTARFALLQKNNGIDPSDLARLQAVAANVEAQLVTIQYNLDHATLTSPIDGIVIASDIQAGGSILPGQTVVTLASLNDLQVDTTDLSERDVVGIRAGQPANIYVEALGKTFPGQVVYVDPRSTKIGGDVVFKVTLQFVKQPAGLLWGMTTKVDITPK